MSDKNKRYLQITRIVFVSITIGIVILCLQSLWTGMAVFQQYALGLAVFGLFIISCIVARVVKSSD